MKRLALALLAGLTGLCCAAMGYGRGVLLPADMRVAGFAACEGKPCLLGIIPGETEWIQAHTVFKGSAASASDKQIIVPLYPDGEAEFYVSVNTHTVGRIYVRFDRPVSVAWIIQRFGRPCGVSIYAAAGMLTVRYPNLLANVEFTEDRFDPDLPVTRVEFSDPAFRLKVQPDLCVDSVTSRQAVNSPWRGFAPLRQYTAS